jgi:hypothetical protein
MWRGSSATAARLTLDTYGHVIDEPYHAPSLAAVDQRHGVAEPGALAREQRDQRFEAPSWVISAGKHR